MSKSIDQRVVEMQFDNKQFENNVKTSMNTIDGLKKSLDFSDSAKGLDRLNRSINDIDVSGLQNGIERVKSNFSALEVFILTTMANISNSIVNMGKKLVNELLLAPRTGFNEYELKMGSIQTIMAGTGESLETVNKYLEELNVYADKTIYSFKDMTSNIGKFTNSGVKLKDAVLAIKGISNEAALSGANTNEASRAMYNFAQALSSGYVKLIDWKSIENANMATKSFKETLIQTALELGTVTKAGDGMYKTLDGKVFGATKDFNDSLQHQWMTTDVLVSTLKDYADETTDIGKKATAAATEVKTFTQLIDTLKEALGTGWATTWEAIVGDFEEAKKLLTNINNVLGDFIGASSDARNALVQGWKEKGGRSIAIKAIGEAFHNIIDVLSQVKKAFRDIFPPITVNNLVDFTKKFKELVDEFKMSDESLDNLRSTARGVFAVLDVIRIVIGKLLKLLSPLVDIVKLFGSVLLTVTGTIGEWLVGIDEMVKGSSTLSDSMSKVSEKIKDGFGLTVLKNFGVALDDIKLKMSGVVDFVDSFGDKLKKAGRSIKNWAKESEAMQGVIAVWGGFFKIIISIWNALGAVLTELSKKIDSAFESFSFDNLFKIVNGGLFSGILLGIKRLIDTLSGSIGNSGIVGIGKNISIILDTARGSLQAYQDQIKAGSLLKIAGAVALLVGSLFLLSTLDEEEMANALLAITVLLGELVGAVSILNTMTLKNFGGIVKTIGIMTALSASMLVLAISLRLISSLKPKQLAAGIAGIAATMGMLIFALNTLPEKAVIKSAGSIVIFALAINVLAIALKKLGSLKIEELRNGLIGLAATMAAMVLALKTVQNFGGISASTGAGILIFAMAIDMMAKSVLRFAKLNWKQMYVGLTTFAATLMLTVTALRFMPEETMLGSAAAMIVMATAIKIMASALTKMGNMSWQQMGIALMGLSIGLGALVIALNSMGGTMAGSGALLIASIALTFFAKAIKTLGSMDLIDILKGLGALAGGLAIFGVACALLTPIVPVILSIAGAVALFGAGIALAGVGIMAVGAGITALAVGFTALGAAVSTGTVAIVAGLKAIIKGFIQMVPEMASSLATGVASFIQAISSSIPSIVASIGKLISGILNVISENGPKITETVLNILISLLSGFAEKMPMFIKAGVDMIIAFLQGVSSMLGRVIDAGFDLIINFVDGLANSIDKNIPRLMSSAGKLAGAIVSGLVKGLFGGVKEVVSAMLNLGSKALGALKNFFGIHSPSKVFTGIGKNLDMSLATGVIKYSNFASDAAKELGKTTLKPVLDMSDISGNKVQDALSRLGNNTATFNPSGYSEGRTIVEHKFGKLVVEGVNNKGEFVAAADYAVEDMLASLMRRQTRR